MRLSEEGRFLVAKEFIKHECLYNAYIPECVDFAARNGAFSDIGRRIGVPYTATPGRATYLPVTFLLNDYWQVWKKINMLKRESHGGGPPYAYVPPKWFQVMYNVLKGSYLSYTLEEFPDDEYDKAGNIKGLENRIWRTPGRYYYTYSRPDTMMETRMLEEMSEHSIRVSKCRLIAMLRSLKLLECNKSPEKQADINLVLGHVQITANTPPAHNRLDGVFDLGIGNDGAMKIEIHMGHLWYMDTVPTRRRNGQHTAPAPTASSRGVSWG